KLINEITTINFDISKEWRWHECFFTPEDNNDQFADSCLGATKQPLIFLWGDSHAAALYVGLKNFGEINNFGIAQYTSAQCVPLVGWTHARSHYRYCKDINDQIIQKIKLLKPALLILHANWKIEHESKDLENTATVLKRLGVKRVLLIGPVPQWREDLPRMIFSNWRKDQINKPPPLYMDTDLDTAIPIIDKNLRELSLGVGFDYISAYEVMCNRKGCLTRVGDDGNQLVSFDYQHLSPAGSMYLINSIAKYLIRELDVPPLLRASDGVKFASSRKEGA